MSKVNCTVTSCSYYDNNLCLADRVSINGSRTNKSECTNCGSFLERKGYGTLTNSTNGGQSDLVCSVSSCKYNENMQRCSLDNIQVEPLTKTPLLYSETYCGSFESK